MGMISCVFCKKEMKADQLNYHINDEHLHPGPFKCLKCPFRSPAFELLELHQAESGHSDESDRWQMSLSNLVTAGWDCSATTKDFMEGHQSKKANSAELLNRFSESIAAVCQIAVEIEKVVRSAGENVSRIQPDQPQVNDEIVFDPQLDHERTRISAKQLPSSRVTRQTPVMLMSKNVVLKSTMGNSSAVPTATKSPQRRSAPVSNSTKTADLSTEPCKAIWVRIPSNPIQNPLSPSEAVRQANLSTSTTLLRGNVAKNIVGAKVLKKVSFEVISKPQLGRKETQISAAKKVPKVPLRKVTRSSRLTRQTYVMLRDTKIGLKSAKESLSAESTAAKSARKRSAPASNSAKTQDLSTERDSNNNKAKRRRNDSPPIQLAEDVIDTGGVQQLNLPTISTAPLQVNSGENQSESSKIEDEFETSDDADVRRSISILSDLAQLQSAAKSPPKLLPAVIELMKVQVDNVQVLMGCRRLIVQHSTGQQLNKLESSLKRSLMEVLLSAVKFHSHDSLIVDTFCRLLWETIDEKDNRKEIDWYLGAIDFLLEVVCDGDNMTTTAIRSALKLLREIAARCDEKQSESIGQKFVERICQSMKIQLDKPEWYDKVMEVSWECLLRSSVGQEEIQEKLLNAGRVDQRGKLDENGYAELVDLGWDCLDWIFYKSVANRKRFVAAGGIRLIRLCYKKFKNEAKLISTMTWVMMKLSEETTIRKDLMANGNVAILWNIWSRTKTQRIKANCVQIFRHFLNVSAAGWPRGHPTIEEVKRKLPTTKTGGRKH